jgi:hypothetical protein
MTLLNFPVTFSDVLPPKEFKTLHEELMTGWTLGNESNQGDSRFWSFPDEEKSRLSFFSAASRIKLKMMKVLRHDLRLFKIHVNGQTSGQNSFFHADSSFPQTYTFVLFMSPRWSTNWGGEFCLFDPIAQDYKFVAYRPNWGTFFPANWDHRGASPNNSTSDMRISVAFSYCHPAIIKEVEGEGRGLYAKFLR